MSKKDEILGKDKNEKTYSLTEYEAKFLKELNVLLQWHIAKNQIISTFLTYVANNRLGYTKIKSGYNLQYEIDLEKDDKKLTIREVPIPDTPIE